MFDEKIMNTPDIKLPVKERKPGRPRAISAELEPIVVEIYRRGYGYRSICCILGEEYHVSADYTTVRRVLKRLGIVDQKQQTNFREPLHDGVVN
jgi:transposase